jgi:hypothetical protein
VFDGAAWDRLKYQLDCPFHVPRLPRPQLCTLSSLTDFESQPGKPHQSNLSHGECEEPEQLQLNPILANFNEYVSRMSTEPDGF